MNHRRNSIAAALLLVCCCTRSASAFVTPSKFHAQLSSYSAQDIHTSTSPFSGISTNKLERHRDRSHSNSCRQTELGAALLPPGKLAAIGIGVAKFYKASPLVAGFLTASTKACVADSMAQYRDVCTTKFDITQP